MQQISLTGVFMIKKYIVCLVLFGHAWSYASSKTPNVSLRKIAILNAYTQAKQEEEARAYLLKNGAVYTIFEQTKQIKVCMPCHFCREKSYIYLPYTAKPHQTVYKFIEDEIIMCDSCYEKEEATEGQKS